MRSVAGNLVVWALSLVVIPAMSILAGEKGITALASFVSAAVGSLTMFGLFCPYVNRLRRRIPDEELAAVENDECGDIFSAMATRREVLRAWREKTDEVSLQHPSEGEILPAYRRLMLELMDLHDPYLSEDFVDAPISEFLWVGNRTKRFSFGKFCKALRR